MRAHCTAQTDPAGETTTHPRGLAAAAAAGIAAAVAGIAAAAAGVAAAGVPERAAAGAAGVPERAAFDNKIHLGIPTGFKGSVSLELLTLKKKKIPQFF